MATHPTLKNGSHVIDSKPCGNGSHVVLCDGWNTITPFVTWVVDSAGNAHWGHYFRNIAEAVEDFQRR